MIALTCECCGVRREFKNAPEACAAGWTCLLFEAANGRTHQYDPFTKWVACEKCPIRERVRPDHEKVHV